MASSSLCSYYFIFQSFLGLMPSIPLRYKAWKSEYVEFIKEISYKEEKQLFTTVAVGLFQEFLNLRIPLPTMFSFCGGQFDRSELEWRSTHKKQKQVQKSWQHCCWLLAGGTDIEINQHYSSGHSELGPIADREPWKGFGNPYANWTYHRGFCGCLAEMHAAMNAYMGKLNVSKLPATLGEHRSKFTFPWGHHTFSALLSVCSSAMCRHSCLFPEPSCHLEALVLLYK